MINAVVLATIVALACVIYLLYFVVRQYAYIDEEGNRITRGTIVRILLAIIAIAGFISSFIFSVKFDNESKRVEIAETIVNQEDYDIIQYRQCANGVFVTFCNNLGQEEGMFLDNYIIEYAEEPFLEIRDVRTTEKKVWKCFYNKGTKRETKYVVYYAFGND